MKSTTVRINKEFIVKFWPSKMYMIYCSDCYYNHDGDGYISLLYNNCGNCFITCPLEVHNKSKFIVGVT